MDSLTKSGTDLWSEVLDAILGSRAKWEDRSFRASMEVRYEAEGFEVMATQPRPRSGWSGGYEWQAWRHCRLFSEPDQGSPMTVEDLMEVAQHAQGARARLPFTCTEELLVENSAWKARRLRRPGAEEETWSRMDAGGPRPDWLRQTGGIPHFREMLDPSLVLSAVEFESVTVEEGGWSLRGTPRLADQAHGYYPAVVHAYGDQWTAIIDSRWGSITQCRTTLKGAQLASHVIAVTISPDTRPAAYAWPT
ncbi:MAG: hypothetical protein ACYDD0_08840 [Candidatus Dormibacteria bacterium]